MTSDNTVTGRILCAPTGLVDGGKILSVPGSLTIFNRLWNLKEYKNDPGINSGINHRMSSIRLREGVLPIIFVLLLMRSDVTAGPPFRTDDPIPIGFHHGEIYLFSAGLVDGDGFSGLGPSLEFNYGLLQNTHVHLVLPVAFSAPSGGKTQMGYGDTEFGVKYRFVEQSDCIPDIATFPLVEIPTGNSSRGLGSGNVQLYLPLWLQKDIGRWTLYGGAGYWINRGTGNENWLFTGLLLQYNFSDQLFLGAELFHQTPASVLLQDNTGVHVGGGFPIIESYQIIFSGDAGNGITRYKHFAYYIGCYHQL